MLIFDTGTETVAPPIKARVAIDVDGDLALKLNDITVAFVNARSGRLSTMTLFDSEVETLRALGIAIGNRRQIAKE